MEEEIKPNNKVKNRKVYVENGIEIAQTIGKLYVTYRKRFIEQYYNKEKDEVTYKENKFTLNDSMILKHLTQQTTIGIFSGSIITSFMCFDVDIKDPFLCKWAVDKIVDALQNIGIAGKYIHISISGNKGYHIDVFFDEPIYVSDVYKIYQIILDNTDLRKVSYGKIEIRPDKTSNGKTLGMKLPLGIHLETKNICWFCDYDKGLAPIKDYNYVLSIEPMPKQILLDILEKEADILITPEQQDKIEAITDKHKPLPEYKNNVDEKFTIEQIENIITNGLTITGSRHNAMFNIIKYYKHLGVSKDDNRDFIIQWMEQQDKTTYTTKWDAILLDIDEMIEYIYSHNCSFVLKNVDIDVSMEEIMEIIKIKGKNDRLVLYSLLIHSKRYAIKSGVFYMSYAQMMKVTGIKSRTTLVKIIKQLEESKLITVTRGETPTFNSKLNKPVSETNRYVVNLLCSNVEIEDGKLFKICDKNCIECFNSCMCYMFTNKELKVMLTDWDYREVTKYRDYCTTNIMVNV